MSSIWSASSRIRISTWSRFDVPLVHQVQQAARRGDEHIDAVLQRPDLRHLADAAEDDRVPQAGEAAVGAEALADLRGQLARRGEDQRADRPAALRAAAGRRASSRWSVGRANAAVLPVPVWAQPNRSRPARIGGIACALDRRGDFVAFLTDGAEQVLGQFQFCKTHNNFLRPIRVNRPASGTSAARAAKQARDGPTTLQMLASHPAWAAHKAVQSGKTAHGASAGRQGARESIAVE